MINSSFRIQVQSAPRAPFVVALLLGLVAAFVVSSIGGSALLKLRLGALVCMAVLAFHLVYRFQQAGFSGLLSPDSLFAIAYCAFTQGYVWLWVVGIAEFSSEIFVDESTLPLAQLIVNVGLLSYLLGYELTGMIARPRAPMTPGRVPTAGWGYLGAGVFFAGVAMHVGTLLAVGIGVTATYGYAALASLGEYVDGFWPLIWGRSPEVILLGLVVYTTFSAFRYQRLFGSPLMMFAILGMALLYVLEGDRGPVFLFAVVMLLVRYYLIKPIPWYYLGGLGVGVILLFGAMGVAREWALAPERMLSEVREAQSAGELRWYSPIAEAGASFRVINATAMLVPDSEPFWRGGSWISAAPKAVPFLGGVLSREGLLSETPSSWITYRMVGSGRAGWGFSLPAEGYLNFGLLGVFAQLGAFGILMRWVCVWYAREPSVLRAVVMLGILAPGIKAVRDHVGAVANVYPLILLFALFAHMLLGSGTFPQRSASPGVTAGRPRHDAALAAKTS